MATRHVGKSYVKEGSIAAILIIVAILATSAVAWYLNWPIKQVADGKCVRILVMETRSKQVEKSCASLTTRFHHVEHVGK